MSTFTDALEQGMQPGASLSDVLEEAGEPTPETVEDAEAVAEALRRTTADGDDDNAITTRLHTLAGLFQDVLGEDEAAFIMRDHAHDALVEAFDHKFARLDDDELNDFPHTSDLMFVLKILVIYGTREGADRVLDAVRRPLDPNGFMWSVVFNAFDEDHHQTGYLFESIGDEIPPRFIAVSYLDAVNALCLETERTDHPFDCDAGVERMRGWLTSDDPDEYSYAVSAAAALPFISQPHRSELLALAMDHSDATVQLESAWASAKTGSESGLAMLARFAADVEHATVACRYLEELGREDAIPEAALDDDFQAKAEMVNWLMHPSEYGEPPSEIELLDTRELHWPPTEDRRQVWLFRYRYNESDDEATPDNEDAGVGMVGSVTFALFGETTADMSPEDCYALHCCWELEVHEDDRAPEDRTIEAGRELLREKNPNAGF